VLDLPADAAAQFVPVVTEQRRDGTAAVAGTSGVLRRGAKRRVTLR
jgi:hypothetical protein